MKNFFTFILAVSFSVSALHAQLLTTGIGSPYFEQMVKSKLMVVLTGQQEFDENITKAVQAYWKVTPYEFIELKNIDNHIQDKSLSFLVPLKTIVTFSSYSSSSPSSPKNSYSKTKSWFVIVNGGKKSFKKYIENDAIAFSPFNLYGDEENYEKSAYRADYMVKGMNDGIEITKNKKISGGPASMPFKMIAIINERSKVLTKKTLVINKDIMNYYGKAVYEEDDFKKNYPYKYKFVPLQEFREIVAGKSDEYLCLLPAFEVNKHVLIYDTSTRETVFYGWSMQGMNVGKKDMEKMIEAVSGK